MAARSCRISHSGSDYRGVGAIITPGVIGTALDDVSQALMGDGTAGIQSVIWEVAKRKA